MQIRILTYSLLYTAIPWLFSLLTFFLFGSSANNSILSMLEEVFFNVVIGVFLMFFLCTPFLLLETKSMGLIDAMKKSAEWMKPERARFFRHVLYFLGLRLIANVLAEMWGYILENSILPGFFLMFFFLFFLSPYYILVQAAFYQDILSKKKMEQERREEEPKTAVEEESKEVVQAVVEAEDKAVPEETSQEASKETSETEPREVSKEEPKKESEEEPKEELSFEEARKRYTDYKEEEES